MEITVQKINQSVVVLEFLQDLEEGIDDVTPLISSLEKMRGIINKLGYGNKFNKAEKELWNSVFDEVLNSNKAEGVQQLQQIGSDRIYVPE